MSPLLWGRGPGTYRREASRITRISFLFSSFKRGGDAKRLHYSPRGSQFLLTSLAVPDLRITVSGLLRFVLCRCEGSPGHLVSRHTQ